MIPALITIGLAAGILAGLFGIGGGVVIVPALVMLLRYPQSTAVGTSLGALLLPVGLLGAWAYWRAGHLEVAAALWLGAGLFVGAWLGARVSLGTSGPMLKRAFAAFLVAIALRLWWEASREGATAPAPAPAPGTATADAARAS